MKNIKEVSLLSDGELIEINGGSVIAILILGVMVGIITGVIIDEVTN